MRKQISYADPKTGLPHTITTIDDSDFDARISALKKARIKDYAVEEFQITSEEIIARMNVIDLRLIRPMAALLNKKNVEPDSDDLRVFNELMGEKAELRARIQKLAGGDSA